MLSIIPYPPVTTSIYSLPPSSWIAFQCGTYLDKDDTGAVKACVVVMMKRAKQMITILKAGEETERIDRPPRCIIILFRFLLVIHSSIQISNRPVGKQVKKDVKCMTKSRQSIIISNRERWWSLSDRSYQYSPLFYMFQPWSHNIKCNQRLALSHTGFLFHKQRSYSLFERRPKGKGCLLPWQSTSKWCYCWWWSWHLYAWASLCHLQLWRIVSILPF